jgi:tetratricopeptide (TPR) repeat protein
VKIISLDLHKEAEETEILVMVVSKESRRDPESIRAAVERVSFTKETSKTMLRSSHGQAQTNLDKEIIKTSSSIVDERGDAWYSGMLSTFFGAATCEEDRNDTREVGGLAVCGRPSSSDGNPLTGSNEKIVTRSPDGTNGEFREDVDSDSTSSESVSTLGRGLGDDLKSLPSVQGGILPGEDGSTLSFENMSSYKKETKDARLSLARSSANNESVESVVEKKINNLKSERSTRESEKIIPFLRRKMFPKTSGRVEETESEQSAPDTILETRRQLLVHELRQAVEAHGRFDVRCANITAALGDLFDENREYKQALRLHHDAVSVYSIKLGDNHQNTLEAKTRLGQVQENAGKYDDAVLTFFNVMSMTKALKGDKDPAAADIMTRIASTLRKKGKYELAIKTLKRALKTYREVLGDSHPSVSTTVDSIASLYVTIGDFAKASAILEEVVKLKAATMGMASKEVAASLSELATCYECAEQYSKAMKNLKKAYKIYADVTGESGEKAILALERIALIYQATGQFKKAAIAYLGVLRGRKRALGEAHPTVADTYFHLGVSLRESGQQDKAFKCMKQALNIYVGEGKDMHDVEMIAEVMHELAIIHKANNNMGDAIKTFKQEIAVRRKLGQPEYPLIAQTLNHLGVAEFEIKNHNRALNYFMEALTIYEKRGNDLGTDFAEVLYNTGLVFESIRNKQRAHDAFLEAARIFKENGYNEDHPHLSKAANKLRRMGHTCQCKNGRCSSVPCETVLLAL